MMEGKINASEFNKAEILYQPKHNTQALHVREGGWGILFRFIICIINTDGFGRSSEEKKKSLPSGGAETKY